MKTKVPVQLLFLGIVILGSSCTKTDPIFQKMESVSAQSIRPQKDISSYLSVPSRTSEVSLEEAIETLKEKERRECTVRTAKIKPIKKSFPIFSSSGKPALYVINYEPEGYVLMSASRKLNPILAFSETGRISEVHNPITVQNLISAYVKRFEELETFPDSTTFIHRLSWEMMNSKKPTSSSRYETIENEKVYQNLLKSLGEWSQDGYKIYTYKSFKEGGSAHNEGGPLIDNSLYSYLTDNIRNEMDEAIRIYSNSRYDRDLYVFILLEQKGGTQHMDPLLKTNWGQENGYAEFVPHGRYAGCVATAIGQIMKYHKFPNTFNWDMMEDNSATRETALLLRDIALRAKMSFEYYGSTTTDALALEALKSYGYTDAELFTPFLYESVFFNMLRDEIVRNRRPAYAAGVRAFEGIGHAFVVDGVRFSDLQYSIKVMALPDSPEGYGSMEYECIYERYLGGKFENSFHLNLGAEGFGNAYYLVDDFSGYVFNRGFILNIYPKSVINNQ